MTNKQAINILLSSKLQAPSDSELVDIQMAVRLAVKALVAIADIHEEQDTDGGRTMTTKENIKAILACNFSGFKDECIETATNRILETVNTTCPNCDSGYAQGYSDGYLKGKEEENEDYNNLLRRFRHLIQSDYIRSFDEWDIEKGDYVRDISEADKVHAEPVKFTNDITADLSGLKAENNRLTAELERVYELLYNGVIASKQEQPRNGCPFGDRRETCAEFRANGCDLCKFDTL